MRREFHLHLIVEEKRKRKEREKERKRERKKERKKERGKKGRCQPARDTFSAAAATIN